MSGEYTKTVREIQEGINKLTADIQALMKRYDIEHPEKLIMREGFLDRSALDSLKMPGEFEEVRMGFRGPVSRNEFYELMVKLDKITEAHRATATNDYASEENVFDNFERIGALLEIPPRKVLMVYLLKHMDSIIRYVNGKESKREPVNGRLEDAVNYLKLLWAWVETEENAGFSSAKERTTSYVKDNPSTTRNTQEDTNPVR